MFILEEDRSIDLQSLSRSKRFPSVVSHHLELSSKFIYRDSKQKLRYVFLNHFSNYIDQSFAKQKDREPNVQVIPHEFLIFQRNSLKGTEHGLYLFLLCSFPFLYYYIKVFPACKLFIKDFWQKIEVSNPIRFLERYA